MNRTRLFSNDWLGIEWGNWVNLNPSAGHLSELPTDEGIYRVRHLDRNGLTYIGETGRNIRRRVQALARGTYNSEMPYRDPHTAAPCLWAIRDRDGPAFEVSVTVPDLATDKQHRKGMEDALIALYRQALGESPTANFGRIIPGYRQSSYRSDGLTGGPLPEGQTEQNASSGVEPLPWTDADKPTSADWMGVDWTVPRPLTDADSSIPETDGIYRIWHRSESPPLEYVGQSSNLRSRLYRHRRNRDESLLFSYATLPKHNALHKREEVETDLLGAHWLACREPPKDQY